MRVATMLLIIMTIVFTLNKHRRINHKNTNTKTKKYITRQSKKYVEINVTRHFFNANGPQGDFLKKTKQKPSLDIV